MSPGIVPCAMSNWICSDAVSSEAGSSAVARAAVDTIESASRFSLTNRRYPSVVTWKPGGTGRPAAARRASDAPLPPTDSSVAMGLSNWRINDRSRGEFIA